MREKRGDKGLLPAIEPNHSLWDGWLSFESTIAEFAVLPVFPLPL